MITLSPNSEYRTRQYCDGLYPVLSHSLCNCSHPAKNMARRMESACKQVVEQAGEIPRLVNQMYIPTNAKLLQRKWCSFNMQCTSASLPAPSLGRRTVSIGSTRAAKANAAIQGKDNPPPLSPSMRRSHQIRPVSNLQ